jgi:hypothetical protein
MSIRAASPALAVLVLAGCGSVFATSSTPATTPAATHAPAAGHAVYKAAIVRGAQKPFALFADTLAFTFQVTNVSKTAGTPVCTIRASSPHGRYAGTDVLDEMDRLGPGQVKYLAGQVTITHNGARFVRRITVSCR